MKKYIVYAILVGLVAGALQGVTADSLTNRGAVIEQAIEGALK